MYDVQARENDRQRGFQKVWDMVLSDYRKHEFNLKCIWTACYTFWQSQAFFSKLKLKTF
jgi:hypothetical protein